MVEKLWLKDREELFLFLQFASNDYIFTPRGRSFLSVEERQRVYDFWKLNSEVTVHRSNDCHIVKINLENVLSQVADLEDDNISLINTMRRKKKQAHKHVTTKCYKTLHSDYKQIYGLYKATKTNVNTDLPKSLSDYQCKNFKCDREPETKFFHRDCILEKCQNRCEILSISDDLKDQHLDEDKVVSFYVFETVKTKCFNKLGKEVSYDRTTHVDKKDLIQNIISQLLSVAMHLIHRFFIINDFIYWRRFLSETEHYTLW